MAKSPKRKRGTTTTPKRIRISIAYSVSTDTNKMPPTNKIIATAVPNIKV